MFMALWSIHVKEQYWVRIKLIFCPISLCQQSQRCQESVAAVCQIVFYFEPPKLMLLQIYRYLDNFPPGQLAAQPYRCIGPDEWLYWLVVEHTGGKYRWVYFYPVGNCSQWGFVLEPSSSEITITIIIITTVIIIIIMNMIIISSSSSSSSSPSLSLLSSSTTSIYHHHHHHY